MQNICRQIFEQIRSGSKLVLATVVRTSGSTPQKPGSSALFGEKGLIAGTVGGGTLEGEVQHIAGNVMISGTSDQFYFNLDTDQDDEGAICGGEAIVLVDANPSSHLQVLEEMEQSLLRRISGNLLTVVGKKLDNGRTIRRYWITDNSGPNLPHGLDPILRDSLSSHIKQAIRYGFTEIDLHPQKQGQQEIVFLEHIKPMPKLVIAGAGHVGKALAHIAALLEFEITIVDDRVEFANRDNIPDADHLVVQHIGKAMSELETGPDTYIVIVTRGHSHDAEALKHCIGSNASYIGMIGSSHKVRVMKKRFLDEKWATTEQWSRIHTPIGITIGSKTVQEIAISIAAQLIDVRNQKRESHAG